MNGCDAVVPASGTVAARYERDPALMLVVRHASAGDGDAWQGDDRLRPLDPQGRRQADALVELLRDFPVARILSSPALRCIQTVEPLASARGLEIEVREELHFDVQDAAAELLRSVRDADAVLAVHGGFEHHFDGEAEFAKGATLVVSADLRVERELAPHV